MWPKGEHGQTHNRISLYCGQRAQTPRTELNPRLPRYIAEIELLFHDWPVTNETGGAMISETSTFLSGGNQFVWLSQMYYVKKKLRATTDSRSVCLMEQPNISVMTIFSNLEGLVLRSRTGEMQIGVAGGMVNQILVLCLSAISETGKLKVQCGDFL